MAGGIKYAEPLPPEQIQLSLWCVAQVEQLLGSNADAKTWTRSWLGLLQAEAKKGFHPTLPPYGFGDSHSYSTVAKAVIRLLDTGAVRHGAECFNYYFPQVNCEGQPC